MGGLYENTTGGTYHVSYGIKGKEQEWFKEAQREGISLGEEKARETARKLKEEGVPLAAMVKATGLSRQKVEAL